MGCYDARCEANGISPAALRRKSDGRMDLAECPSTRRVTTRCKRIGVAPRANSKVFLGSNPSPVLFGYWCFAESIGEQDS